MVPASPRHGSPPALSEGSCAGPSDGRPPRRPALVLKHAVEFLSFSIADALSTLCPPVLPCFAGSPRFGVAGELERRLAPHPRPRTPPALPRYRIPMDLRRFLTVWSPLLSGCRCLATA